LINDAALWFHLKKENAIISSRLNKPYQLQFHEVVAFAEGNKMAEMVDKMLQPIFNPLSPIIPLAPS